MNELDDLLQVFIEHAERIGIGQHHTEDGIVTGSFEGLQVHISAIVGGDRYDLQPQHARRGRVRAMGGIRDEHFCAFRIAA